MKRSLYIETATPSEMASEFEVDNASSTLPVAVRWTPEIDGFSELWYPKNAKPGSPIRRSVLPLMVLPFSSL